MCTLQLQVQFVCRYCKKTASGAYCTNASSDASCTLGRPPKHIFSHKKNMALGFSAPRTNIYLVKKKFGGQKIIIKGCP
jgi:hypothetical protein